MKEKEVVLMKGNEAIAHAAIRCGCDGYFGYPITPQSEILETLALEKPWETTGMVVVQAESELASLLAKVMTDEIVIKDTVNGLPVTEIAYQCFYGDERIKSIVLPDTIVVIEGSAFEKCSGLLSITIKNPDCNLVSGIYYSISNDTERVEWKEGKKRYSKYIPKYSGTIYGYEDSTAQAYADKYDFNFEILKGETQATTLGDVNGDGRIVSVDASNILASYAVFSTGQASPTTKEIASSDVNSDGKVDSIDASKVLSFYAYNSSSGTLSFTDYLKK